MKFGLRHWAAIIGLTLALAPAPALAPPLIIPVIIAVVAYAAEWITLTALIITVATAALSFAAQALLTPAAKGQSTESFANANIGIDQKQNVKQAAAPRKIVVGKTRVGGVYAFVNTTDINQNLHLAIMYAGHEIEEVVQFWIDEEPQTLAVFIGGAHPDMSTSPKHNGIAFFYYANHLGTADQAADSLMINGFSFYTSGNAPLWTVNHRLQGIYYAYIRLLWENQGPQPQGATQWSGGLPNITCVLKGLKVFDPRTGLTAWTDNSALIVAWYLTDKTYGIGADYATRIDEPALIAAANICDEMVATIDPEDPDSTVLEKRYTTNGSWDSDASPDQVLGRLLGAMHGKAIFDGDVWTIYAGAYQVPTDTLTDDDMRAGSSIQTLTSAQSSFNAVKGTYIGPDQSWQSADFPAVKSEEYKAQDGGIEAYKDITVPFTDTPGRAQRIAKIDLTLARQEIMETLKGKLSVWRFKTGDNVYRDSERYGWDQKLFCITNSKFAVEGDGTNITLGIDLVLQEIAADAWDWSTDIESPVDPAKNTNFPETFNVSPPSNVAAAESLYVTRTGSPKAMLTVTWDASPDSFVTSGGKYQARYRIQGTEQWTYSPEVPATTTHVDVLDVAAGTYEIQAASINWAGRVSQWSPMSPLVFPLAGLGAKPAAPTGLQFSAGGLGTYAQLRWNKTTDLDVEFGGAVYVKHSSLTVGASWDTAVTMADPMDGKQTQAALPLKTGTYLLKFLDSTGNWSDAASAISKQDGSMEFFPLDDVVENDDFAGVKNGCVVGVLGLTIEENAS